MDGSAWGEQAHCDAAGNNYHPPSCLCLFFCGLAVSEVALGDGALDVYAEGVPCSTLRLPDMSLCRTADLLLAGWIDGRWWMVDDGLDWDLISGNFPPISAVCDYFGRELPRQGTIIHSKQTANIQPHPHPHRTSHSWGTGHSSWQHLVLSYASCHAPFRRPVHRPSSYATHGAAVNPRQRSPPPPPPPPRHPPLNHPRSQQYRSISPKRKLNHG
jgi:hypothetical protein